MNREIKFRAFVETHDGKEMINDWCFLNTKDNHFNAVDITNERPDIGEVYSVMQFTGLTDKNGKEIYEGDILKIDKTPQPFSFHSIHKVEYVEQSGRFHLIGTHYDNMREGISDVSGKNCCEVIGNIHENANLL